MNLFFILLMLRQAGLIPAQTPPDTPAQAAQSVKAGPPPNPTKQGVTAFKDSPHAPPPKVKDLQVPLAPVSPGPTTPQGIDANAPLGAIEAIQIALKRQPNLGVHIGAIQSQEGQTAQTGANLHPTGTLVAGYDAIQSLTTVPPGQQAEVSNELTPAGVSPLYPYNIGVGVKQLLFDFNMTRNLVRQSEALERSQKQNLTVAQLSLVQSVATAFYNYADGLRTVSVNEENVANRQRQLDLAVANNRNGVGEPSDVATAETSKSQAILQLNLARNTAEQNRVLLLQQMGVDPLTPIVVSNDPAPEPAGKDAHDMTTTAIKLRPEVKSAVEALVAAKYGMSAAKAVDMPQIYAEIGAGFDGTSSPFNTQVLNLGLGLSFPFLDGGYRAGAIKSAQGQITDADSNLKTAVLQVRTDVATAYMALLSAEQRVVIAANEVQNAAEDVRIAEGRYRAGVGLFQDITTAQGLLVTALTDQETARNALDLSRTQLRRATGELLADIR